jgi:histidyl-tRNA synthetase
MTRIEPRLLKGFRDYLPDVERARLAMLDAVRGVFESFGFGPLQTPAIEYAEILLGKYGDEGDKLLYRFLDNGERDVALRYDLTVPLARVVGLYHGQLQWPFRRYQMAPVWRAEKPARGRFREFMQCDVDIVGEPSFRADAEIMAVGLTVLKALGVPSCVMRVNDRRILDGVLDVLGVPAGMPRVLALRAMDKLPKVGPEAVLAELGTQAGLARETAERLLAALDRRILKRADLAPLRTLLADSEVGLRGLDGLEALLDLLAEAGLADSVEIDLTIARGLDYYTATIYETFLRDHEGYGSVMSGGRYDGLMDAFSGKPTPAVGISLGVDRLLAALTETGLLKVGGAPADVFLCLLEPAAHGRAMRAAAALRAAGLRVEAGLAESRLGKQLQAAAKRGFRHVLIASAAELDAGQLQLKDLETGHQEVVTLSDVAQWAPRLASRGPAAGT